MFFFWKTHNFIIFTNNFNKIKIKTIIEFRLNPLILANKIIGFDYKNK